MKKYFPRLFGTFLNPMIKKFCCKWAFTCSTTSGRQSHEAPFHSIFLQFCSCYGEREDVSHCRLEVPCWVFLLPSRVRYDLEMEWRSSACLFLEIASIQQWNCSWEKLLGQGDEVIRCPFLSDTKLSMFWVSVDSFCLLVRSFALKRLIDWNTILVELSSRLHVENLQLQWPASELVSLV